MLFLHNVYSSINETCGPYEYTCTGCSSLRLCMNGSAYGTELICERGYCNQQSPDVCISQPPAGCDRIDTSTSPGFKCESEGVFAVACSACTKFKLCTDRHDGSFDEINVECPESTLFDPDVRRCSRKYRCPDESCTLRSSGSSNTSSIQIKLDYDVCSTGQKFPVADSDCKSYFSCFSGDNGLFEFDYGNCVGSLLFDPYEEKCSASYSCLGDTNEISEINELIVTPSPPAVPIICSREGKLYVPCTNCQEYVLCVRLLNGSFGENYAKCPTSTRFNPISEKCTMFYECPEENCNIEIETDILNNEISDLEFVTTEYNHVHINNNGDELINHSTEKIDKFSCPSIGNFPIEGNCNEFYSCDDNLTAIIKECPLGFNFNSKLLACMNDTSFCNYTNVVEPSSGFQCPFFGRYPLMNNCSGYYFCDRNLEWTIEPCYEGTQFNQHTHRCDNDFICSTHTENHTEKSFLNMSAPKIRKARQVAPLQNGVFTCTKYGRFPDVGSECTQYYYCPPTLLTAYLYKCPTGFFFDPNIQSCSSTYLCPETNPLCTTIGQYPIVGTNCQQYVFCFIDADGVMQENVETCNDPDLFNPVLQICQNGYICAENIVTTTTIKPIVCTQFGRFPIENSDCTKYHYCDLAMNAYIFKCPTGTFYDPTKHTCTSDYDCLLNQPFKCTSIGLYPMAGTECKNYYYCGTDANGVLLPPVETICAQGLFNPASQQCETAYICPEVQIPQVRKKRESHPLFECKTIGLFPVLDDHCNHYYYCSVDPNGKFLETILETCPEGKRFNPALQICQNDYVCPERETFDCKSPGRFLVPDTECREYFVCNNRLNFVRVACPEGTYFDPFDQQCDKAHKCFDRSDDMECKTIGKHAVRGSFCREYFFCGINEKLELVPSALIKCPEGVLFNPALQICDTDYVCSETTKQRSSGLYRIGWWWNY